MHLERECFWSSAFVVVNGYCATSIAGGFHVPSPGGSIDGGVSFGQYRRITI
jgi:hypothetical protein